MSSEAEERRRKKRDLLIRLLREKRLRDRGDNFLRNPETFLNPRRNHQSSAATAAPPSSAADANPDPGHAGPELPSAESLSPTDIEEETSPSFILETPETPIYPTPTTDVANPSIPEPEQEAEAEAPPPSTEPQPPQEEPKIFPVVDGTDDVIYGVQTPSGGIITSDFLFGDEIAEPELECHLRVTETEPESEPSPDDVLDRSEDEFAGFSPESFGEEVGSFEGGGGGDGDGDGADPGGESSSSSNSKRKKLKVTSVRALGWLLLPSVFAAFLSLFVHFHGFLIFLTFFVMRRWANQYFELNGNRQAAVAEIQDQISAADSSLPIWTRFAHLALKLLFEGKMISLHLAGYVVTFVALSVLFDL